VEDDSAERVSGIMRGAMVGEEESGEGEVVTSGEDVCSIYCVR
jgi:hypothetical protein